DHVLLAGEGARNGHGRDAHAFGDVLERYLRTSLVGHEPQPRRARAHTRDPRQKFNRTLQDCHRLLGAKAALMMPGVICTCPRDLMPKRVTILGSTGSIGHYALSVIYGSRYELSVAALSASRH